MLKESPLTSQAFVCVSSGKLCVCVCVCALVSLHTHACLFQKVVVFLKTVTVDFLDFLSYVSFVLSLNNLMYSYSFN